MKDIFKSKTIIELNFYLKRMWIYEYKRLSIVLSLRNIKISKFNIKKEYLKQKVYERTENKFYFLLKIFFLKCIN